MHKAPGWIHRDRGLLQELPEGVPSGLFDLVVAMAQQLPPPPAAQGGAANREDAAKGWGLNPGLALGIQILIAHVCLPSVSAQRYRCQSRCELRRPGSWSPDGGRG